VNNETLTKQLAARKDQERIPAQEKTGKREKEEKSKKITQIRSTLPTQKKIQQGRKGVTLAYPIWGNRRGWLCRIDDRGIQRGYTKNLSRPEEEKGGIPKGMEKEGVFGDLGGGGREYRYAQFVQDGGRGEVDEKAKRTICIGLDGVEEKKRQGDGGKREKKVGAVVSLSLEKDRGKGPNRAPENPGINGKRFNHRKSEEKKGKEKMTEKTFGGSHKARKKN